MNRAEIIAALVTDKFSGFKDGDETILETCSDQRLEEFRALGEARKTAANGTVRLETENRNLAARVTVLEGKVRENEQELSEEEFLSRAPKSIKDLVDGFRAEEAAQKASIIVQLKDLGQHAEEDLKKMPLAELKTLAGYARVSVPDFSGRGVARREASGNDKHNYAPPDPYAAALAARRASNTKH